MRRNAINIRPFHRMKLRARRFWNLNSTYSGFHEAIGLVVWEKSEYLYRNERSWSTDTAGFRWRPSCTTRAARVNLNISKRRIYRFRESATRRRFMRDGLLKNACVRTRIRTRNVREAIIRRTRVRVQRCRIVS